MTPLDLRIIRPRSCRDTMLGFYFLPRTIDKLRAELPGGNVGPYLNHDTGFSAFVVRKIGVSMDELRDVVARASDESEVESWLAARVDATQAPALNAKVETFTASRMSPDDRVLVRERHPVMAERPDLDRIVDILDADDELLFAR
ncbi:MAG: DUF5069 domain-containing protein [Candidatus Eremiobacteraeota bacterium]|nr:DUF5069 domain-containing protein [Candidatus Eremiobacteraeota bacterium]